MNIAAAIQERLGAEFAARLWRGSVTSTSPLEVDPLGETTGVPCKRLASYTVTLSDTVLVYRGGGENIILGKVTT